MKTFDELWRFVCERSSGFPVVQEYHELEYIFNKMQGCNSYLEVGSAEGNSLYVLSHALVGAAAITCVDFGEKHTYEAREAVFALLSERPRFIAGNSHAAQIIGDAVGHPYDKFDVVLIDAGHTYEDVIADAIAYGSLATKYIFFHDIMLPPVNAAFEWYCKQRPNCKAYRIVNSDTFGYGIMEIAQ